MGARNAFQGFELFDIYDCHGFLVIANALSYRRNDGKASSRTAKDYMSCKVH
jgi:hypothetical protein